MKQITDSLGILAENTEPIKLPPDRDLTVEEVGAVINIISENSNWKDEILNESNINKGFFHIRGLVAQKLRGPPLDNAFQTVIKKLKIVSSDDTEGGADAEAEAETEGGADAEAEAEADAEAEAKYDEIIGQINNS